MDALNGGVEAQHGTVVGSVGVAGGYRFRITQDEERNPDRIHSKSDPC